MRFKDIIKEVMTSTKREPLRSEPKCESPVVPVDHIGTGIKDRYVVTHIITINHE